MNIDNLTIGELRDALSVLETLNMKESNMLSRFVGSWVLSRSRNAGLIFGRVVCIDHTGVVLSDARRLWYHKPVEGSWYEGIAVNGLHKDSKLSAPVQERAIVEAYELSFVSSTAVDSLINAPVYDDNSN